MHELLDAVGQEGIMQFPISFCLQFSLVKISKDANSQFCNFRMELLCIDLRT